MKQVIILAIICAYSTHLAAQDITFRQGNDVSLFMQKIDTPVVHSAMKMLAEDVEQVLGSKLTPVNKAKRAQITATLNPALPREGFQICVKKGKLTIEGADAHGLAFGLLEVSRLMGVSPWEWWADSKTERHDVTIPCRYHTAQSPAVAYRGIFINDEDWGILPWSGGVIGPDTNERIFQLMLRLRANYYWPSMHEVSKPFFTIPGNREMAHRYGIYIGGSHCEPMGTSPATEWKMRGVGDYNYVSNAAAVQKFWADRLDEVKDQDMVYTIGMRGVHDGSMQGVKTKEEKLYYLQKVIDDQRKMLAERVNKNVESIPQIFVPYKEVLDIYHSGLQVPDDVTLVWTDDNYGYIRHFPDSIELSRCGGNGIYYHVSYWGRPHDYLWLGTFSPWLLRHQLTEAYRRGIRQMWILNAGDIKPAEYLVEDFLNMAWHGVDGATDEDTELRQFFSREFGAAVADTIASLMTDHYRLAFIRKPEHLGGTRTEEADRNYWNTFRAIQDWTQADVATRIVDYQRLSDAVEEISENIPRNQRDAFFQLVKYPIQAAAQMNFKFLRSEENQEAYDSIVSLTRIYNENPRWNGIMDMAPRKLAVFGRITEPIAYPSDEKHETIIFSSDTWKPFDKDETLSFTLNTAADSITLDIRLLPTHPVDGKRLAFTVAMDDEEPVEQDYQTYDRSEEWKQNVLRNFAHRRVALPLTAGKTLHTLKFQALTEGVCLERISY